MRKDPAVEKDHPLDEDQLFKFIGPLSFKVADKFFKFLSWGVLIVALRYVYDVTKSVPVKYLENISIGVFSVSLLVQALYIGIRHPETLGVPKYFYKFAKIIQMIIALVLGCTITSPYFFMDQILDAIHTARLK